MISGEEPRRGPRHVAVIMDGNGRWASARGLPRTAGHRQGVEALRRTVRAALDIGIEALTIYSFSAENWSRPKAEVSFLFELLRRYILQDVAELHQAGVRIKIVGERQGLAPDLLALLEDAERLTRDNRKLALVVAFNYGSRQEIVQAATRLVEAARAGTLGPGAVTPELFASCLGTSEFSDPDLLIRTGGEQRLSNFLLWQCAYTEFVFLREYWPDFDAALLERAIGEYMTRDRRYGGLKQRTA